MSGVAVAYNFTPITWLFACVAEGDTLFTTVIPLPHLQMMSSSKEGEARTGAGQSTGEDISVGCMYMYTSTTQNNNIIKRNHQSKAGFFSCRFLPLNFKKDDILGIHKDRMKIGASLADVDPMHIDRTVSCHFSPNFDIIE